MAVSLQVLYPTDNGTTFDHDYYTSKHAAIVGQHMGPHFDTVSISKGLAGGPDIPAGYHVITTLTFADQAALDAALAAAGPVMEDVPNFYSGQPQVLIGEVVG
ncbi:MAG: EthD family reductase [Hyphomicrobiales bacterium]|nr:EthD family reductase [Hyphomicrobiales bacterium]